MKDTVKRMKRQVTVPQKINIELSHDPAIPFVFTLEKLKQCSHKNLYMSICSSFIHNCYELDQAKYFSTGEYLYLQTASGTSLQCDDTQQ